jgi:hypothetical protein
MGRLQGREAGRGLNRIGYEEEVIFEFCNRKVELSISESLHLFSTPLAVPIVSVAIDIHISEVEIQRPFHVCVDCSLFPCIFFN